LSPVPPPVQDKYPTAKIISPSADSRSITEGDSIDFQGYVTGGDSPLAYTWDFGGGADVRYMENPGEVFFHQTGSYIVTFTVRDADGDMSKDSLEITVKEITPEPVDPGPEDNNNNSDESDQGNAGDTDEDDSTGDAGDTDENDSNSDPSANPQTDPDPEIPEPNTDIFCPPLLFEPQDTETDISLTPDFVIGFEGDGEESISYPQIHWQISSDENFTYPEFDEISDFAEFFTPDVSLAPETMYFWRVKCLGSEGEAQWSDVWSFTTVSEDSEPTLNPPSDPTETDDEIIRDDDSETPEEFERPFEKSSLGDAGGMGCFIDVLKEMQ
ncbi:MAG: PKD domain-containing protein, partial [Desulfococcaceae bacterium]|nr:PKD domain-containing protein [Desulfococcaceae bacterium]